MEVIRLYEVLTPLRGVTATVDISPVAHRKAEAVRCNASQVRHVRFDGVALEQNRFRSVLLRSSVHAEAFGTARAAR